MVLVYIIYRETSRGFRKHSRSQSQSGFDFGQITVLEGDGAKRTAEGDETDDITARILKLSYGFDTVSAEWFREVAERKPNILGGVLEFHNLIEVGLESLSLARAGAVDFFVDNDANIVKVEMLGKEANELGIIWVILAHLGELFNDVDEVDIMDGGKGADVGADFVDGGEEKNDDDDHQDVEENDIA